MDSTKEPTMAELYSHPELNVKRKRKWGWLLISFIIFSITQNVKLNQYRIITQVLYLLSIFVAPIVYYRLKPKIKFIKNGLLRSFLLGIFIIFSFLILSTILGVIGDALVFDYIK